MTRIKPERICGKCKIKFIGGTTYCANCLIDDNNLKGLLIKMKGRIKNE